ncbi:hypothetical protein SVAN01_04591 [Stagonosporopsis vannaccii]|nr:hypothetical protein SVAN01_04591 [Stagonosporopsis vannaccii]
MGHLTATLLFAALATAQTTNITTTAWMTNFAGSNKFGYVASVINADAEHMTLALDFDATTDKDALHLGGPGGNYTFGQSQFTLQQAMTRYQPPPPGDLNVAVACSQPAQTDADVTCSGTLGDGYARFAFCNEYQTTGTQNREPRTLSTQYPHTYGTGPWGEAGTETVTRIDTFTYRTDTTTPAWCTSDDVPESVLTTGFTTTAGEFAVYQIVIYAGQEKLSAYSGDAAQISTASPSTGSVPGATASAGSSGSAVASATQSAPPESTGAAGKINAMVPALAGVGVAAIMGML